MLYNPNAFFARRLKLLQRDSRYNTSAAYTKAVNELECKIFEGIGVNDFIALAQKIDKIDKIY